MASKFTTCHWITGMGTICGAQAETRFGGLCQVHRVAKWEQTRTIVHRALDNAVANGYDDSHLTDEEQAESLQELDADLECDLQEDILPHVQSWRADRKEEQKHGS